MNFIMTIGISGSGKTTWCNANSHPGDIVLDSDAMRQQLWGDANDQQNPAAVFAAMKTQAIAALKNNHNVYYCATNLAAKYRILLLKELRQQVKEVQCKAVVFGVPIEVCKERNAARERQVPNEVIKRQMLQFQIPFAAEGWDEIEVVHNGSMYPVQELVERIRKFGDQHNAWHTLSLMKHSAKCNALMCAKTYNPLLRTAAWLHDVGKVVAKTEDRLGNWHYYGHECAGAYMVCCTTLDLKVAQLVGAHMYPYQNVELWEKRCGKNVWEEIMMLHECDREAH